MDRDRKNELLAMYESGDESVYDEAIALYEQALETEPDNPVLLFEYGILQEFKGIRLLRRAASNFEKGLLSEKDSPYFKCPSIKLKLNAQIIGVRARLFENDKNIEFYKERIKENPMEISFYYFLTNSYLKADQVHEAKKVAESCSKIFPKDASLHSILGDIYSRLGMMDEALKYWQLSVQLDSELIDSRYSMAFFFKRENRLTEAAEQWKEIIKFCHNNGFHIEAEWPEKELADIESKLSKTI